MSQDRIQEEWRHIAERLRRRWPRLTKDDVLAPDGSVEYLTRLLQERYGLERREALLQVHEFESGLGEPTPGPPHRSHLPRLLQPEEASITEAEQPVPGGTETVLIVDDDDAVRELVAAIVSDLGYRVFEARDAEGALAVIESGPQIDLLFTDVGMPGPLKTTDFVRMARERQPSLAVLYTSGYTQSAAVGRGLLGERAELLSKPYGSDTLARKFRHVLDNARGRLESEHD